MRGHASCFLHQSTKLSVGLARRTFVSLSHVALTFLFLWVAPETMFVVVVFSSFGVCYCNVFLAISPDCNQRAINE